jgi:tRNA G37 N-methylase Trm5
MHSDGDAKQNDSFGSLNLNSKIFEMTVGLACRDPALVSVAKRVLTESGMYDRKLNACRLDTGVVVLPLMMAADTLQHQGSLSSWLPAPLLPHVNQFSVIQDAAFMPSKSAKAANAATPLTRIAAYLDKLVGDTAAASLMATFPDKWEHYHDFLLLSETAFMDPAWQSVLSRANIGAQLLNGIADAFGVRHMARKARIPADDLLRKPTLSWLVRHTDLSVVFWTWVRQNGLEYHWTPEHTMFCQGNITEKARVAHDPIFRSDNQVVLDLYAGVGYFTLPYVVHAGARRVYACEMNPWSVQGLQRGLEANRIRYALLNDAACRDAIPDDAQVVVMEGDHADWVHRYERLVDRVNLGLLPTSEQGWPLAVRALNPNGGWLHVHVNLKRDGLDAWLLVLKTRLLDLFGVYHSQSAWTVVVEHVECVKSFAPRVYHYVADVHCRPVTTHNIDIK